jgi:proline racemase
VLLDAGNGTYAAPVAITVPAGTGNSVRVADFNADGKLDLVVRRRGIERLHRR